MRVMYSLANLGITPCVVTTAKRRSKRAGCLWNCFGTVVAAEQLDREAGTDYKAILSDQEPADLIFIKLAATVNRHHKVVRGFFT